jgi:hypothetical protein
MSEHRRRMSLASRMSSKGGLLAWSLACTVTGAAIGFWSPLVVTYVESLLGVDALSVVAAYAESECGGAIGLAGLEQGSDPSAFVEAHDDWNRLAVPVWSDQEPSVVPFQVAIVRLTLESKTDEVLVVHRITPVVHRTDERTLHWSVVGEQGCGGELSTRDYFARLDETPIRIEREDESASSGFTVSRADPSEILLDLRACGATYEFGLEIEYSVRGVKRRLQVASPERPFVLADGQASHTYALGVDGDLQQYEPESLCDTTTKAELDTGGQADEEAAWESACEQITSQLSTSDQVLLGCAGEAEYVMEFEAACARAEPYLPPEWFATIGCDGDGAR